MKTIGSVPAVETGPGRTLQGLAKRTEGAPVVALAGTLDAANAISVMTEICADSENGFAV